MNLEYIFLFLVMIFMGAEAMLVAGSLSHFGVFNFGIAFVLILLGLLISDTIFYHLGKSFGEKFVKKFGKFILISETRFQKMKIAFEKRGWLVIFFSKFIYCLGHLTSAVAGSVQMNFKKFFFTQIVSSTSSVLVFLSLGYFYSSFINSITKDFKVIGLSIIGFLILFILLEKTILKIFNRKFLNMIKEKIPNGLKNMVKNGG
jgi:membrane protein DedA with SNARE-associated domain